MINKVATPSELEALELELAANTARYDELMLVAGRKAISLSSVIAEYRAISKSFTVSLQSVNEDFLNFVIEEKWANRKAPVCNAKAVYIRVYNAAGVRTFSYLVDYYDNRSKGPCSRYARVMQRAAELVVQFRLGDFPADFSGKTGAN